MEEMMLLAELAAPGGSSMADNAVRSFPGGPDSIRQFASSAQEGENNPTLLTLENVQMTAASVPSMAGSCERAESADSASANSTVSTTKTPSSSVEHRQCRICSDKSDGAHFGVDSCRACAAFFRRSIVMKKKYVCRQGSHSCLINKTVRCMCRKCRFVKCLQCGMLPENVQAKRTLSEDSAPATPTGAASQPECPSSSTDAASAFQIPSTSAQDIRSDILATATSVIPRPLPIAPTASNGVPRLLQIDNNYKLLCQLRRSTELSLQNDDLRGIFEAANKEMHKTNFMMLNKIMKGSIPMTADFCNKTFPEFSDLEQDEKWIVFQNFLAALWNTEGIYRTWRVFPNDPTKKVTSCTTYVDLEQLDEFFEGMPSNVDKRHLAQLLRKSIAENTQRIVRMCERIGFSDIELGALVALSMWPPYLAKGSNRILDVALRVRDAIFRELHVYYSRILRLEDYACRLGDLMSLYSSLQWSTNRMKEDMEIFKLFDVFTADSFFYDIIRN